MLLSWKMELVGCAVVMKDGACRLCFCHERWSFSALVLSWKMEIVGFGVVMKNDACRLRLWYRNGRWILLAVVLSWKMEIVGCCAVIKACWLLCCHKGWNLSAVVSLWRMELVGCSVFKCCRCVKFVKTEGRSRLMAGRRRSLVNLKINTRSTNHWKTNHIYYKY